MARTGCIQTHFRGAELIYYPTARLKGENQTTAKTERPKSFKPVNLELQTQPKRRNIMKLKSTLVLSSFLLALGLTACPGGGTTPPGQGNLSATFSNANGTTSITQTAFSASAGVSKSTSLNATIIAGKQGNRLVTLSFTPVITANRTCTVKEECSIAIVENGVSAGSTVINLNAAVSGGNLVISGTATFKQINGATFDAQLNGTLPYAP
jgi:hypothetical protein